MKTTTKHNTIMKKGKFLILSTLLLACSTLVAQTETTENPLRKGRIVGDIDLGFSKNSGTHSHSTYEGDLESDITNTILDLSIGYTVMDNLVVGLHGTIDHNKTEITYPNLIGFDNSSGKTTELLSIKSFLLNADYYFGNDRNIRPFLGLGLGFAHFKAEEDAEYDTDGAYPTESYEISGGGFAYMVSAGFAFFINDHIGINVKYAYSANSSSPEGSGNSNGYEYDINSEDKNSTSNLMVGFTFAF